MPCREAYKGGFHYGKGICPPKAKPAENKLERPVKERKGTTSKKTEKEQKEGEGE